MKTELGAGLGRALALGEEAGLGAGLGAGSRGVRLRVCRGSWRHDGHVGEEGVKQTDAMGPFVAIEWKAAGSQLRQHIHDRHPVENLSWGGFAHVFPRTSDTGVLRASGFEPARARVSKMGGRNTQANIQRRRRAHA